MPCKRLGNSRKEHTIFGKLPYVPQISVLGNIELCAYLAILHMDELAWRCAGTWRAIISQIRSASDWPCKRIPSASRQWYIHFWDLPKVNTVAIYYSIRFRLKALFIVVVTVVLAISGTYSQYKLNQELEARFKQLADGIVTRLQTSMPVTMWDFDKTKGSSIIDAEMFQPDVLAIRVLDTHDKPFVGKMRNVAGEIVPIAENTIIEGSPVDVRLSFHRSADDSKPAVVGHALVNLSRASINAALRAELIRKILEVLVLDAVLVLALSVSLRMVFTPLGQLRDGLFGLAAAETEDVKELPEQRHDEFGDVAQGFNRILRKLKSIIVRAHQAEEAAQFAALQTNRALEDLRKAQDSLVQAERLASLGGLVAGVAHEINTPVGITVTSASVLQDATERMQATMAAGGIKKSDILSYLEIAVESARLISTNANRAAHLIMSFKQIAADQTSEARRSFVLKDYLDEVMMSLRPRLKQTKIQVVVECPGGMTMDSFPGAFAQIITNLTMNALIHAFGADSEGEIRIEAQLEDDWVVLQFKDNGKGIPAENVDKIFDPFFTTQRGQGGTGLGLNIVYNLIVKQFGGTIKVSSVFGQGANFIIRVPQVVPQ